MKLILPFILMILTHQLVWAEPIVLDTPTGKLHGTLELPNAATSPAGTPADTTNAKALPCSVAVIIAGSGPTDRNGNTIGLPGQNDSLKLLAEGLAARGIASVRYDKRGIGESIIPNLVEAEMRPSALIEDAVLWGRKLRQDPRFTTLTIIGHSEGALFGTVASHQLPADGFVSVAGMGLPFGELLLKQLRPKLPPDLMAQSEQIVQSLNEGKTVTNVPPALDALFRPSVQPYLIDLCRYSPTEELKKLTMSVLIVQGTTDIQVSVEDAELLSKALPTAQKVLIEGMNHVLKMVPNDQARQIASYTDPTLPVSPQLLGEISKFVGSIPAKAAQPASTEPSATEPSATKFSATQQPKEMR
jgi:pimeloyl-ACP methyl ester carboxylesterase